MFYARLFSFLPPHVELESLLCHLQYGGLFLQMCLDFLFYCNNFTLNLELQDISLPRFVLFINCSLFCASLQLSRTNLFPCISQLTKFSYTISLLRTLLLLVIVKLVYNFVDKFLSLFSNLQIPDVARLVQFAARLYGMKYSCDLKVGFLSFSLCYSH